MEIAGTSYTDSVRTAIRTVFVELGCDVAAGLSETIMIRGGSYCGRRFECPGGWAVWFLEEHQIKFFRPDGALCRVMSAPGAASAAAQRRAA